MNKKILNEVKRNRELMGLNESEVDEQLGTAIRQGIEKGKNFVKGLFNKNKPESDEGENENTEEVEKYNNVPISDIIQDIKDMNKSRGKIVVNGETLYFGVGESMDRETAKKIAQKNVENAFVPTEDIETTNFSDEEGNNVERTVVDTEIKGGYGEIVIRELMQKTDGNYVYYILSKK